MAETVTTLTIDGATVEVPVGTSVLEAAHAAGISVPTLCWLPKRTAWASCFVCAVRVEGQRRLVPSCATRVVEGMQVTTDSEEIRRHRRTVIELLLSDHLGDCVAPCRHVCPAHLDIPGMNVAIAEGRLEDAARIVKDTIPLPATLGRICPTPCEQRCRRKPIDDAVAVCALKQYVGDQEVASDHPYVPERAPATGKHVAVVGSGPAGLSAAYFLARHGHACTVYEAKPELGGALRYELTEERLPRAVLDAEIEVIRQAGVEFQPNQHASVEQLMGKYDAVVLAVGPVAGQDLGPVAVGDRGVKARKGSGETNVPGVYATGGAVAPGKISVRSIGDGHAVADAVHVYLGGSMPVGPRYTHEVAKNSIGFAEARTVFATGAVRSADHDLTAEQAVEQASRCLQCGCAKASDCVLRDLAGSLGADASAYKSVDRPAVIDSSHPDVIFEESKCIACGICLQIAAEHNERLGLALYGRGFEMRVKGPFREPLSRALTTAAKACAEACPTGALYLRRPEHGE